MCVEVLLKAAIYKGRGELHYVKSFCSQRTCCVSVPKPERVSNVTSAESNMEAFQSVHTSTCSNHTRGSRIGLSKCSNPETHLVLRFSHVRLRLHSFLNRFFKIRLQSTDIWLGHCKKVSRGNGKCGGCWREKRFLKWEHFWGVTASFGQCGFFLGGVTGLLESDNFFIF